MNKSVMPILILTFLVAHATCCRAQVGGNVGFSQTGGKAKAEQNERSKRVLTKEELPSSRNSMFVEANVLMRSGDEYVVVFGLSQEGQTVADSAARWMPRSSSSPTN